MIRPYTADTETQLRARVERLKKWARWVCRDDRRQLREQLDRVLDELDAARADLAAWRATHNQTGATR